MKPTLRRNGTFMVTMRVTHQLTFTMLVALLVEEFCEDGSRTDPDEKWSRSKVLKQAKQNLEWGMTNFISDGAFDEVSNEQRAAAEDFVDKLFPEMNRGEVQPKWPRT